MSEQTQTSTTEQEPVSAPVEQNAGTQPAEVPVTPDEQPAADAEQDNAMKSEYETKIQALMEQTDFYSKKAQELEEKFELVKAGVKVESTDAVNAFIKKVQDEATSFETAIELAKKAYPSHFKCSFIPIVTTGTKTVGIGTALDTSNDSFVNGFQSQSPMMRGE